MTGKHHVMTGVAVAGCLTASLIISGNQNPIVFSCVPVATILGSVFPDIDIKNSKIGQKAKITSTVISNLFGHRGFVHSPVFAAILYFLLWGLFNRFGIAEYAPIYIGFICGMAMHLTCDLCTKGGIPLFSPFSLKKFRLSKLETGNKFEILTVFEISLLCVGVAYLLLRLKFYPQRLVADFSWIGDLFANAKK